MEWAPKTREKIEVEDIVLSTNHVVFLAIFVSGRSGITFILKYRSVNPIVNLT